MTSSIASSPSYTILSALAQAAQTRAQQSQTVQLAEIDKQIQNRLNVKIAAVQAAPDNAATSVLQDQVTDVSNAKTNLTNLQKQYSSNLTLITDLQTQLANLQTAAQNGDSTAFDGYLSTANTDIADLQIIALNPIFQPDGVSSLKSNGLGIGSSSSYDLSTAAGQTAAATAISAAQAIVNQVSLVTGTNITIAGGQIDALAKQYDNDNSQLQAQQSAQSNASQTEITTLTKQAQTQEHLIELALGNSQELAAQLLAQENPPAPPTSVLGVIENAVGQTATSYEQQSKADASAPAILSLFA